MSIYRRSSACGPPILLLYMFNVCICHKCFLMLFAFSFSVVFFFWRTDVCNFDEVWPILLILWLVSFVSATSFYNLQPHNHRDTALCFLLEDSQYNSLLPALASHTAQFTFVDSASQRTYPLQLLSSFDANSKHLCTVCITPLIVFLS